MGWRRIDFDHAIQHKMAYAPLNMRMAAAGMAGYANTAVMFFPFLGFMTGLLRPMLLITCIAWGVVLLFQSNHPYPSRV